MMAAPPAITKSFIPFCVALLFFPILARFIHTWPACAIGATTTFAIGHGFFSNWDGNPTPTPNAILCLTTAALEWLSNSHEYDVH